MSVVKSFIWRLLSHFVALFYKRQYKFIYNPSGNSLQYSSLSFSQLGEDFIIVRLLKEYKKSPNDGIYIDIGCFDPFKFSNTYLLYLMGWHGINVDGNSKKIQAFNKYRKRDINIHAYVYSSSETMFFLEYLKEATNRLSFRKDEKNALGEMPLRGTDVLTININTLLNNCFPENTELHLLSIDLEGLDFTVLRSLDLDLYRPFLICVEAHGILIAESIINYMKAKNFKMCFSNLVSYIFIDSRSTDKLAEQDPNNL